MKIPFIGWFISLPASMFYCMAASSLYETLDSPFGFPSLVELFAAVFLPSSIALWVLADARRSHRQLAYDFGAFTFITWPVSVPIYLFHTRGWRAFAPLGCFVLLYIAADVASVLPSLFSSSP